MSQSSPWSLVWKMLGIVLLTYLMANMIFLIVYGLWEQDFMLTIGSTFCSFPLVFLFVWLRRPKLKHILSAFPVEGGQTIHPITDNRVLHTSVPTRFAHHLIRILHRLNFHLLELFGQFFRDGVCFNWGFSSGADYRSSSCDIAGNSRRCTGMVGWI